LFFDVQIIEPSRIDCFSACHKIARELVIQPANINQSNSFFERIQKTYRQLVEKL